VGFIASLVPDLAGQPDVIDQALKCMDRIRRLLSDLHGDAACFIDFDAAQLALPYFGKDWTNAVGAYRLARFTQQGLTAPNQAARIEKGITSNWPAIRASFSLEAQGELFTKIAECNAKIAKVFNHCDILIAPSLGLEAYPANGPPSLIAMGETLPRTDHTDPFQAMMPLNYSGHPAGVIRAGLSQSGLPCAVQIIADRGREDHILALAALYEKRYGCFDSWPRWPFRHEVGAARL